MIELKELDQSEILNEYQFNELILNSMPKTNESCFKNTDS